MKRLLTIAVLCAAALALLAGAAFAETLMVKSKEGVGSYLADAKGMTLYYFKNDSPGKSACSGACLGRWPVFYSDKITPPAGAAEGDFGSITRDDGKKQTTFRGYPLYYFAGDAKTGDTAGQGVNNVWFVVDPASFMMK